MDPNALAKLVAKDEIRDLAMIYSRAIDRQDFELVHSLYTADATDTHGAKHYATVDAFVDDLRKALPEVHYTGHHICNHLISVDGDTGEGEVYALAYHLLPMADGGCDEFLLAVRYLDHYRKDDGRWRFSKRVVTFDWETHRPVAVPNGPAPADDESYRTLTMRVFQRGARA
jgi:hypothetical protein